MLKCIQSDEQVKHIYRSKIRCVLEFEGKLYSIIARSKDEALVVGIRWNFYQGFKQVEEEIPQNLLLFAKKMIALHLEDSASYPLKGEWYSVQIYSGHGKLQWRLRRKKQSRDTTLITATSFLLHVVVAVAFAGLILSWTLDRTQAWIYSLLPNLDRWALALIAHVIAYAGSVLLLVLFGDWRNLSALYFNAFIPLGLIVAAGLLKCHWWMWLVLPIGMCLASLVVTFGISVVEERDVALLEGIRIALILLSLILLLLTIWGKLTPYVHSSRPIDWSETELEEAEKQHRRNCIGLDDFEWWLLDSQERLDLLKAVSDYECKFVLGCEPVKVYSGLTSGASVVGMYTYQSKSIMIDEAYLRECTAEDAVNTILHETRHVYQHCVAEMYDSLEVYIKDEYKSLLPFQEARDFLENFRDYSSGEDGFDAYYEQAVEADSREWAEKRIEEYYKYLIYPDQYQVGG